MLKPSVSSELLSEGQRRHSFVDILLTIAQIHVVRAFDDAEAPWFNRREAEIADISRNGSVPSRQVERDGGCTAEIRR